MGSSKTHPVCERLGVVGKGEGKTKSKAFIQRSLKIEIIGNVAGRRPELSCLDHGLPELEKACRMNLALAAFSSAPAETEIFKNMIAMQ